jgi:hypothetical protein
MQLIWVKIIIIISLITAVFLTYVWQVNKAVDKAVAEQTIKHNQQIQSLTEKSLKVECNIKDNVSKITGEKDAKIKDITLKYNAAVDSLRQHSAPSPTSDSTSNTCNAESTTGTIEQGLFEKHAQISLGIARDAEELKTHLLACYQQYDTVKDQLDTYRK